MVDFSKKLMSLMTQGFNSITLSCDILFSTNNIEHNYNGKALKPVMATKSSLLVGLHWLFVLFDN